jgi:NAD(P)-dependent dehydrogenase (short-subunit alcohol dehydrogenase family)
MARALVTGAGRGIGREVAAQLAQRGYDVVVTARTRAAADEVAAEVGGTALVLDVTDPTLVAEVADRVGELDVLVSNAAAFADWTETALSADLDAVDTLWHTNVVGPWRLAQAFMPALHRSGHGRLVMVTSGSGSHGDPDFGLATGPVSTSYAVTKAAANALVRKLAQVADGVLVNAVDPGLTATAPGMETMGARPVAEGAASVVWAATLTDDGPTGGFFRDGEPLPW